MTFLSSIRNSLEARLLASAMAVGAANYAYATTPINVMPLSRSSSEPSGSWQFELDKMQRQFDEVYQVLSDMKTEPTVDNGIAKLRTEKSGSRKAKKLDLYLVECGGKPVSLQIDYKSDKPQSLTFEVPAFGQNPAMKATYFLKGLDVQYPEGSKSMALAVPWEPRKPIIEYRIGSGGGFVSWDCVDPWTPVPGIGAPYQEMWTIRQVMKNVRKRAGL